MDAIKVQNRAVAMVHGVGFSRPAEVNTKKRMGVNRIPPPMPKSPAKIPETTPPTTNIKNNINSSYPKILNFIELRVL